MTSLLVGARPNLEVRNVPASIDFYQRTLGLEPMTTMGEPPVFALLTGGGATLAIAEAAEPAVAQIAACYVDVTDVEALFERCQAARVDVTNPLTTHPWGMRDFVFSDLDGHQIAVGQRLSTS